MLLLLKGPKNAEIITYFFAKHDHKFMSRTAITLKFKMP